MQLGKYLSDQSIPIPEFARRIGVSTQAVHRYISGERIPHLEVMDKIEAETGGNVLPNDLYATARERASTPPTQDAAA